VTEETVLDLPEPQPLELVECILGLRVTLRSLDPQSERHRNLKRQIDGLRNRLAKQLETPEPRYVPQEIGNWIVTPVWRVEGVPRKRDREDARRWLSDRNIEWDGSAPQLRYAVRSALQRGEHIPSNGFGLFISLSARVTTNLKRLTAQLADDEDLDLDDVQARSLSISEAPV
jgi:hypothetical protein